MPGEPPISTSEPGTRPPPSTRSSSPMPVRMRATAAASTSASGTGRSAPAGRGAAARGRGGARLLDERVPLAAARAAAVPLGALVAARGADEEGARAGHAAKLSARVDGFAPAVRPPHARVPSVRRRRLHRSVNLLEQPVAGAEYLAVDTETNGLGGDLCEMTEVGAVLVGGGELHETLRVARARGAPAVARDPALHRHHPGHGGRCPAAGRGAAGGGRADRGTRARRPQRPLRHARAAPGVRARRPRLARARRALHGRAGPPVRPAGAPARAGAAGRRARDRGATRCTARCPTRSPARACSAPCSRGCAQTRRRSATRWSCCGRRRRARKTEPAERDPAAERPDLSTLPDDPGVYVFRDDRGPAAVHRQVGVAALARPRPFLRARRAGPSAPRSWTTGPPTRSSARSCSRTG